MLMSSPPHGSGRYIIPANYVTLVPNDSDLARSRYGNEIVSDEEARRQDNDSTILIIQDTVVPTNRDEGAGKGLTSQVYVQTSGARG
ncbi:hypothetical protein N7466_001574 [Penicillium verhagenii]|uniref:uncharacterized protein n=1 Tax=Penicillium verhagenii TaxID=1562060 RepID=UPI00254514DA|nr:uncharacterized protein N7466_001574 [Penicillium verhagenii]KAJ5938440.1 hypothetical protein N7466_001574 [Penicillium verhagenii]